MYDIVFFGERNNNWDILKERFPTAKNITNLENINKITFTKMYWLVYDDLIINEDFNFDYKIEEWDQKYVHSFLNNGNYNGISLIPKTKNISKREAEYRFFVDKKEIPIEASTPNPYDVVFISYNEPNADKNYKKLLEIVPCAKRVNGINGIHQAHIEAAKISDTKMLWIVDADAIVVNEFNFSYLPSVWEQDAVHVWRSKNPINGLSYGYGGIKLFPRDLTLSLDINTPDMTTSISDRFRIHEDISNLTEFNTDPFNTWKSAFRECVKLSSRTITRQNEKETQDRLQIWMTVGADMQYGIYCIDGARSGNEYGIKNKDDKKALAMINNFDWLKEKFDEQCN